MSQTESSHKIQSPFPSMYPLVGQSQVLEAADNSKFVAQAVHVVAKTRHSVHGEVQGRQSPLPSMK